MNGDFTFDLELTLPDTSFIRLCILCYKRFYAQDTERECEYELNVVWITRRAYVGCRD